MSDRTDGNRKLSRLLFNENNKIPPANMIIRPEATHTCELTPGDNVIVSPDIKIQPLNSRAQGTAGINKYQVSAAGVVRSVLSGLAHYNQFMEADSFLLPTRFVGMSLRSTECIERLSCHLTKILFRFSNFAF